MEPEGLKQPATYPYPKPDQSSPYSPPLIPILSQISPVHTARHLSLS